METKNCMDCGAVIKGRSDKKFCDDQCRSHFNNLQHTDKLNIQRPVNAILRRNHYILAKLCVTGTCRIVKDELLQRGFNINYHTILKNIQARPITFATIMVTENKRTGCM